VDPRTGDLQGRKVFVKVPSDEGIPDGLTVDREGFVWSAQWYGSQVVRYAPDGSVERRIRLPVPQVSSVAFGGQDLADLYITTAADPWPSRLAPPGFDPGAPEMGGSLYRLQPGVRGKPEHLARIGNGGHTWTSC
jgi:D-xylonolactonase